MDNNIFNLLNILKKDIKEENWAEIIRIAFPLSKPLWISRNYELRIKHGELIKQACDKLIGIEVEEIIIDDKPFKVKYIMSSVLVDDLGWTLYEFDKERIEEIEQNITEGIKLAEDEKYIYGVIKGWRHLSGIKGESNHFDEMQRINDKLKMIQSGLESKDLPIEELNPIKASVSYAIAKSELFRLEKVFKNLPKEDNKKRVNEILKHLEISISCFGGNSGAREHVRSLYVMAKVYLKINSFYGREVERDDLDTAVKHLNNGLNLCKIHGLREDNIRISKLLLEEKNIRIRLLAKNETNDIKNDACRIYKDIRQEMKGFGKKNGYEKEINQIYKKIKKYKI
jgi:hypothetical protein